MSLVFAAIVPHSPLLISTIGKEHATALQRTISSLMRIDEALVASGADTLICITSHISLDKPALIFNSCQSYDANFEAFGEYGLRFTVAGDPAFTHRLKQPFDTERDAVSVVVTSRSSLDYTISTPLYFFKGKSTLGLIPIGDTLPINVRQLGLGERLRTYLLQTHRRVAVIASGNLSHRLNARSPAGFSPRARAFDRRVLSLIKNRQSLGLTRFRAETIADVRECALGPILLLFGLLSVSQYTPEVLSYESPFGIGHATILFRI